MATSFRPYRGEDDYRRIREFPVAIQPRLETRLYCTIGDLDWWRAADDDPDSVRRIGIWFDGDTVVGLAWPTGNQVDLVVDPGHGELLTEMLAFAEERHRGQAADLTTWAFESDRARRDAWRRRGYVPTEHAFYLRRRSLEDPIAEPLLPPGYALRHVRGEEDVECRVAVHRDAFAPSRMTPAKHRAVMRSPTYRPDLDLVVVAPDGCFAAYCIVWLDEVNRSGLFEPVGTHSAHRRLGLGKAVLLEGMRRLASPGARMAYVVSLVDAVPANALYDSVGLRPVDRNRAWQKAP